MRAIDVVQGSPEWIKARLGRPTASAFDRIITPRTMKYAAGASKYIAQLVAETLLGEPVLDYTNTAMERGNDLEDDARKWYEFHTGNRVTQVGLVLHDDYEAGGSPDGLVGDDGGLEIKCPMPVRHVENCLGGEIAKATQVQGCMWATGRAWWDVLSYHPEVDRLPPKLIRIERDEAMMLAMDDLIGGRFLAELADAIDAVMGHTWDDALFASAMIVKVRAMHRAGKVTAADIDTVEMLTEQQQFGLLREFIDQMEAADA